MAEKRGMKALELWCRRVTDGYPGVKIENMTTSWRDGLAFCALIHHFRPDLIDFDRLDKRDIYKNNELAFRIAERQLGIPALLDAEDMVEYEVPDRLSILTYLSQFYQTFVSSQQGTTSPSQRTHSSSVSEILSASSSSPSSKVGAGRLETCWSCRRPVFLAERLVAFGKLRHRTCFTCVRCGHQLNLVGCYETENGDFVCETCPDEEKSHDAADSKDKTNHDASHKDEYSLNFEEALDEGKSDYLAEEEREMEGEEEQVSENVQSGECESGMREEIAKIVDEIVEDAVKTARGRVAIEEVEEDAKETADEGNMETEVLLDNKFLDETGTDNKPIIEAAQDGGSEEKAIKDDVCEKKDETENYPEDLNPFGDEDEVEMRPKPTVTVSKPPVPATRHRRTVVLNKDGKKIIEAPVTNLNPFWSDGEPSSEEEPEKPVPAPRTSLRTPDRRFGSSTSLSSLGSSVSTSRRKKGPAPQPPTWSPPSPSSSRSSPTGCDSRSPVSHRSHRKSKPAPPPPIAQTRLDFSKELLTEKNEKNNENKVKQNLSVPDKSTYGKWKRKKGQAPALPIPPQRRRITPLPLPDLYLELEDLEVQQRELERQGVAVEQTIRQYEGEADEIEDLDGGKDIEGLILQLFEIVNQKNELFRRQAELMYLRRQQRLEEEHADLEYQIRCLMGRPERNKTDSDKAQEEDLIRRLVEVVERRNEIIQCLDMDRRREVEEDMSIHHHLEVFAAKGAVEDGHESASKSSKSLLKFIKKKKTKKDKHKEASNHTKRDADKDIDEAVKEDDAKSIKTKKKWFSKQTLTHS